MGVRGPILAIDVVPCPISSITGANTNANSFRSTIVSRSTTSAKDSAIKKDGTSPASSLSVMDSLMVILDSCGTAKFTVFSFYTYEPETDLLTYTVVPIARSVTVKIPAANVSGVTNKHHCIFI